MFSVSTASARKGIRKLRPLIAAGSLAAFLLTYLAETSPALHAWLHAETEAESGCGSVSCGGHHHSPDGSDEDSELPAEPHLCGLLVLAAGFLVDTPAPWLVEPDGFTNRYEPECGRIALPWATHGLPRGRAPPVNG